jgi:hypothetical protein
MIRPGVAKHLQRFSAIVCPKQCRMPHTQMQMQIRKRYDIGIV